MDAEQTLALVRRLNSVEVTLETGRRYTLVLTSLDRQIASGFVSMPLMREAAKAEVDGKPEDKAEDERFVEVMRAMYETYDRWLAEAIIGIDGEDVTMTLEAVHMIPEDEREELIDYLKRKKDPLAAAPT